MKRILVASVLAGLLSSGAWAGASDTATVSTSISAIHELAVTGGTFSLAVTAAVAGQAPTAVTNATATYAITTNEAAHLTAQLGVAMPAGVTLSLTVSPTLGTTAGKVALTASAQSVVTAISPGNVTGEGLSFELAATSAAGVLADVAKVVTLTIVAP